MLEIEASLDNLPLSLRQRVKGLLENPYAGSKAFRYNHEDAKYISNCHGTMLYVFNLPDPSSIRNACPITINPFDMEEFIKRFFSPCHNLKTGNLVAFHSGINNSLKIPLHSALFLGQDNNIFHQKGTGGKFCIETIDEEVNFFKSIGHREIAVKGFKLKS